MTATTHPPVNTDSSKLAALLRRKMQKTTVARLWKDGQPQEASLLQVAGELKPALAAAMKDRLTGLEHATNLAGSPIIGVCGTVNSGKSTLVGSFLSAGNRPLVLVGDYEADATQRFVFWLPESLRHDDVTRRCFDEMFANQFGSHAEHLSDDAAAAARQYNARDAGGRKLGVPLVAHDAALDEHHLSFLDCPDIQRPMDEESLEFTSHVRLEALVKAARLCSAFIVVTSQEQLPAKTTKIILTQLREHAPGLPVFLVVNKASGDAAADIANAEKIFSDWGVMDTVRGIYHAPYQKEVHERTLWPVFTNRAGEEISGMPAGLDASDLGKAYVRSSVTELRTTLDQTIEFLRDREKSVTSEVREVQKHLRQFLAEKFLDESGHVRTLFSSGISKAILESMERTAPWEIRLAMRLNKPLAALTGALKKGAAGAAEWVRSHSPLGSKSPKSPWKNPDCIHTVTPESFADHLKPHRCIRTNVSADKLEKVWKSALRALLEIDMPAEERDDKSIDKIMKKLWGEVPWFKRAFVALVLPASLVASVVAVLFISHIDFGATAVKLASIQELLAAMGISALFHKAAIDELTRHLEKRAGLQQVADLHAALQDGLCLPREQDAELRHRQSGRKLSLPSPVVAHLPGITTVLDVPVIELDPEALQGIHESLDEAQP